MPVCSRPRATSSSNLVNCLLVLLLFLAAPLTSSAQPIAGLEASVSPEPRASEQAVSDGLIDAEIHAHMDRIARAAGQHVSYTLRLNNNLKTFRATVTCRGPVRYSLIIDVDFYHQLKQYGEQAVVYVLAHEYGHFLQFEANPALRQQVCNRSVSNLRTIELMADTSAGFILQEMYGASNRLRLLRLISGLADYQFANVNHHGTVTERNSAYGMGSYASYLDYQLDMGKLYRRADTFENHLFGAFRNTAAAQSAEFENMIAELFE